MGINPHFIYKYFFFTFSHYENRIFMELIYYIRILLQRKWVIITTTFATLIAIAIGTYYATPIYQASTTLRVSIAASGLTNYYELNYSERLMNTYIEIATSGPVLKELMQHLNLGEPPEITAEMLTNTELIKITVEDTNPRQAMEAANALADILISQSDQFYSGSGKSQQEILKEQLSQVQAEVAQAQQEYDKLATQIPPTQSPENVGNLLTAKQSLESKQKTYEILLDQFISGDINQQKIIGEQLDQIRTEIEQSQKDYDALRSQIPPTQSPAEIEKINSAKQSLELKQTTYETLTNEYNNARLQDALQANMLSVVEPAVLPDKPFKPNVLLNITLGIVVGLFGGLGLVVVFENLDTTLYSTEQIESFTKSPILAKIPKANKHQLNICLNDYSPFAEAFRNLRVKIQLANNQQLPKVLMIMSAEPKQGKSTIVSNLAFSLTQAGKRVVVVDADLRLPTLHKLFNVDNEFGLENIQNDTVNPGKTLQTSPYCDVMVLPSSSRIADPLQLLASPEMDKLILNLSKEFDIILLDTPAFIVGSDVAVLAQKVDNIILVVRRAHANRNSFQATLNFLNEYPDQFIGLVINQAEMSKNYYYHTQKQNTNNYVNNIKAQSIEKDKQDQ